MRHAEPSPAGRAPDAAAGSEAVRAGHENHLPSRITYFIGRLAGRAINGVMNLQDRLGRGPAEAEAVDAEVVSPAAGMTGTAAPRRMSLEDELSVIADPSLGLDDQQAVLALRSTELHADDLLLTIDAWRRVLGRPDTSGRQPEPGQDGQPDRLAG